MAKLEEMIRKLPPELEQEVEDFIEFLLLKRSGGDYANLSIQQKTLEKIWVSDTEDLYEV